MVEVVAITVFCLLVVAFYAFFAPFIGGRTWEFVLIAAYSPVALLVFILYVRCTAINPADPGIMSKFNSKITNKSNTNHGFSVKDLPRKFDEFGSGVNSSPSSISKSSIAPANSSKKGSVGDFGGVDIQPATTKSYPIELFFCALFVHEDCRKQEGLVEQQGAGDDALFCTLCNAEVLHYNKCNCRWYPNLMHLILFALVVSTFQSMTVLELRSASSANIAEVVINAWMVSITIAGDFPSGASNLSVILQLQWLNNCVGHKNYATFILLMAISLVWLVTEVGIGIAVLVRCFVNKNSMETEIIDRLGNGFSRAPFATVVAVCTAVSLLACIPLGELFFFHIILIRKGITTYEYVVAMRAMSEAPAGASVDEELPNILYSPTGSTTTGLSGGSSLGLQYKGAWCTPPRVFVDYQDEVVPHLEPGMVPSTVDPDAAGVAERGPKVPKRPVRISAWKLAKLDSSEAMRAAAKARASSSVLRPVDNHRLPDSEFSSSSNISVRSSVSTDMGANKENKHEMGLSSLRNSIAPSQGSRDEYETGTQSISSFSSPSHIHESVTLSPLPQAHAFGRFSAAASVPGVPDRPVTSKAAFPNINNSITNTSSGFDEKIMQKGSVTDPLLLSAPAASLLRDIKKTSVVWDQEAGRYVSVPLSASEGRNRSSIHIELPNSTAQISSQTRRPIIPPQESSLGLKAPVQQAEKLMYTGDSIFFGGPLLSVPVRDSLKNERGLDPRESHERMTLNLSRESRFKRDSASNQLPVFVPGGSNHNPLSGSHLK
ncbi:hypothetical protein JRO89_XS12G0167500 [Xanthoceras sorbifolium]|uniref:S-acyltransferase n=1 Tax=Xanthoceras sorbifolium TaxID=99658 RepID=A0ABQ8HCX4_9ROSI|nr:hypothetical protein JRO89_XS12G0167500 [Xanthoceras sorbifolium]